MIASELRETVTVALLQQLDAAHPNPMSAAQLLIPLKLSGLPGITAPDVESLIADLADKQWVQSIESKAAGELKRYRRTDAARVWLRESGF